jgi:lipopolysaccharide export system permease protein
MTSTLDLIRDPSPRHMGELAWRLGLGLSAINLMLLALALSTSNPRVGRSYHTALALLIFVVYYNMINVGQSWIGSGKVSFTGFLLGLHGSVLVLALLWIAARHLNLSLRKLFSLGRKKPRLQS